MIRATFRCLQIAALACISATCAKPDDSCCNGEQEPAAALSGASVYQLDHEFRDQAGTPRRLVDYRGRPVLITMIFTHCSFACPAIVADLERVVAALEPKSNTHVVLVTMDAARDQPQVLASFADKHNLKPDRYTLLHGDTNAVAEVAAALGVRFAQVDGGDFSHSNQIALLDAGGEIVHRHQGLAADVAPLIEAIQEQR